MPIIQKRVEDVYVYKAGTLLPQYKEIIGSEVPYWTFFFKLGNVLIDTGHVKISNEVVRVIDGVDVAFITHHHEDHVGNAFLLEKKGINVYAHDRTLDVLRNPPELKLYRELVWGKPKQAKGKPLDKGVLKEYGIKALYTPGHTFDHVSYIIDNYIFIGDLMAGKNPPLIAFKDENFQQIIKSLELILSKKFDIAFSGTGVYTREEVEKYLEKLIELKEKVRALHSDGKSIEEIVKIILPNPPMIVLAMENISEGEWSRRYLIESLLNNYK